MHKAGYVHKEAKTERAQLTKMICQLFTRAKDTKDWAQQTIQNNRELTKKGNNKYVVEVSIGSFSVNMVAGYMSLETSHAHSDRTSVCRQGLKFLIHTMEYYKKESSSVLC